MYNFGKDKKMTERPEKEPKFSMQNPGDKFIIRFVLITLAVVAVLIALAVLLWYML
ncbi:MAG: hypothetical protein HUJ61_02570 [Bacilli bacterium]|nr:hypothetical protein [Bacilli bacterium]